MDVQQQSVPMSQQQQQQYSSQTSVGYSQERNQQMYSTVPQQLHYQQQQLSHTNQSVQPSLTGQLVQSNQPSQSGQSNKPSQPGQLNQPSQSGQPVQSNQSVQSAQVPGNMFPMQMQQYPSPQMLQSSDVKQQYVNSDAPSTDRTYFPKTFGSSNQVKEHIGTEKINHVIANLRKNIEKIVENTLIEVCNIFVTDLGANNEKLFQLFERPVNYTNISIESKSTQDTKPAKTTCEAIIAKGIKVGDICKRTVSLNSRTGKYCNQHLSKEKNIVGIPPLIDNGKKTCQAMLKKGNYRDTKCTQPVSKDSMEYCNRHKAKYAQQSKDQKPASQQPMSGIPPKFYGIFPRGLGDVKNELEDESEEEDESADN